MVCIPTTSGTGSEVTPFSVVTDDATGAKYPLADYALTPHMAIVDPHVRLIWGLEGGRVWPRSTGGGALGSPGAGRGAGKFRGCV
jgi:hypothetical protein